jgi:hypothetical protein
VTEPFVPGEHVLLREVWRGRVWTARPVIVVEDSAELIALFIPRGATWRRPLDADGMPKRIPAGDWTLGEEFWTNDVVRVSAPGERFSILPFRDDRGNFRFWYLNIEAPLARTDLGFDYMDQTLDIIVSGDFSGWRWKDEEELALAAALGVYTPEQAADIRAAGEAAVTQFLARKPPFDRDWRVWRPQPEWKVPELPSGWDTVR